MKLSDLLPPERVREIAKRGANCEAETAVRGAIVENAAPDIARAVLLWAADRFDERWMFETEASKMLRMMAQEIEP